MQFVFFQVKLSVKPDVFDPMVCEKEFREACLKNSISNSDLVSSSSPTPPPTPIFPLFHFETFFYF